MNRNTIVNTIALFAGIVTVPLILAAAPVKGRNPKGFIPMWTSQTGGDVSLLVNTDEIIFIRPIEPNLLSDEMGFKLELTMSNGNMIQVAEDFDEFVERVRDARR